MCKALTCGRCFAWIKHPSDSFDDVMFSEYSLDNGNPSLNRLYQRRQRAIPHLVRWFSHRFIYRDFPYVPICSYVFSRNFHFRWGYDLKDHIMSWKIIDNHPFPYDNVLKDPFHHELSWLNHPLILKRTLWIFQNPPQFCSTQHASGAESALGASWYRWRCSRGFFGPALGAEAPV